MARPADLPVFDRVLHTAERCLTIHAAVRNTRAHAARLRMVARGRSIEGGSSDWAAAPDTSALRRRIWLGFRSGTLFLANGAAGAASGTGEPCVVCGGGIARDQSDFEIVLPRAAHAHGDCYVIWQDESRAFVAAMRMRGEQDGAAPSP